MAQISDPISFLSEDLLVRAVVIIYCAIRNLRCENAGLQPDGFPSSQ